MSRSLKKGPFTNAKLMKKIITSWDSRKPIKTWSRWSVITPEMIWKVIEIHNWKAFVQVLVNENMVWHKLWEFAPTRRFTGHSWRNK